MSWDLDIVLWIQHNLRSQLWDTVFASVTHAMDFSVLALAIGVILLIPKRTRTMGAAVLIATVLAAVIGTGMMKLMISRPRPFEVYPYIEPLVTAARMTSFPSGHTAGIFAAATAAYFYNRKTGATLMLAGVLIAFTRLYCFVHFPTDVLAGLLLGTICGGMAFLTLDSIKRWKEYRDEEYFDDH